MNILIINSFNYLKGGSDRATFDIIEILENHGHKVAYFSTINSKNLPSKWSKYFVKYYDLTSKHNFLDKLKIVFRIWYNFEARKKLNLLIKNFQPDIAHLHNIYHHLSPSVIDELKKHNIPIVQTLHDYKLVSPNYLLLLKNEIWEKTKNGNYFNCVIDKAVKDSYLKSLVCTIEAYLHKWMRVYEKVDIFISPSQFLIDKYKEFGFRREIINLPNPFLSRHKRKLQKTNKKEKYILYYGRLSKEKGIDNAIEAFNQLKTDVKFYIIGSGPEDKNIKKLIKNYNLEDKVKLKGYKSGRDLWNFINNAVVIIVPSTWYENFPYTVVESMSLGKIVIGAKIGGITEQIDHGKNGFLYNPYSIKDLKSNIEKVLSMSYADKKKIGNQARISIDKKCNEELFYDKLVKIYYKLIKKNENKK